MKTEIDKIYNEICNGESKYSKGYINSEIRDIIKKYNVKSYEGGVHTCIVVNDELVSYKYDVAQDVCHALKKQNEES
jgi:hypothetical protein